MLFKHPSSSVATNTLVPQCQWGKWLYIKDVCTKEGVGQMWTQGVRGNADVRKKTIDNYLLIIAVAYLFADKNNWIFSNF